MNTKKEKINNTDTHRFFKMHTDNRIKICVNLFFVSVHLCLFQTGCGPTYPKEIVDKAVIQLCKEEYGIDVGAKVTGTTIAVYLPIKNILDQNLKLSKEATDKINDVILSVSRVTLSTDAPIKFYIVIAQDPKFSELEVVIIRYVNDIKMFHFNQISRGEFTNRALIELKLTPQAQKEKILKSIFEEFEVQETDELMNEFLAKEVSTIGDIGYWNNEFYIKEINLEEFLALQIIERTKRRLMNEPEFKNRVKLESINGRYTASPSKFFEFDLNLAPLDENKLFISEDDKDVMFKTMLEVAGLVLHGYKYEDYQALSLKDKLDGEWLVLTKSELDDFRKGKIKIGDLRK